MIDWLSISHIGLTDYLSFFSPIFFQSFDIESMLKWQNKFTKGKQHSQFVFVNLFSAKGERNYVGFFTVVIDQDQTPHTLLSDHGSLHCLIFFNPFPNKPLFSLTRLQYTSFEYTVGKVEISRNEPPFHRA